MTESVSISIGVLALVVARHPGRCGRRNSTIRIQYQDGETLWI